MRLETSRDLLSQAIVESLKSWPELQRRIFIEMHYGGRSVADISRIFGLSQSEVIQILQHCEHKLYQALKVFRDGTSEEMSEEPPHPLTHAAACSCC